MRNQIADRTAGRRLWMIRYLEGQEKDVCRDLWEEAFPEDSREFGDYYFAEKMKDNRVLVREEEGRIVSMLHQNPYEIYVRGQVWRSDYIVGVATAGDKRHRGYMRQLLSRMMEEMWEEQMPFCFLMPADEAIYRPFGFVYIFDQPKWGLKGDVSLEIRPLLPWKDSAGADRWLATIAGWMDQWLKKRYQVYAVRDEAYLRRLLKELESEDGTFDILYHDEAMAGVRCAWGSRSREQRLLMAEPQYMIETAPAKPAIMARIICMEQFVKAVRLREDAPVELLRILLEVADPLVVSNQGIWHWNLTRETSWLERYGQLAGTEEVQVSATSLEDHMEQPVPDIKITIAELTGWLFGYHIPASAGEYGNLIQTLDGVFLDEVV